MTDEIPRIGLPSTWREWRYVLVATLHELGDDGPWFTSSVLQQACDLFDQPMRDVGYLMDAASRRSFDRAVRDLRERGVILADNDNGYRLAEWVKE